VPTLKAAQSAERSLSALIQRERGRRPSPSADPAVVAKVVQIACGTRLFAIKRHIESNHRAHRSGRLAPLQPGLANAGMAKLLPR
jgi:hypothetical protein